MARTKKTQIVETAPIEVEPKPKRPVGAPSLYTREKAIEICARISNGESLAQMVKDPNMPVQSTVYKWLLENPEFSEMYTRAREWQADTNADQILQIADEHPPEYTDDKGRTMLDSSYIAWQRSRIDARKWTAMKLKPRKYGDRMQMAGDSENPLEMKVDMGIFETILKAVELKRQTELNV
jgi:hypothetical protein